MPDSFHLETTQILLVYWICAGLASTALLEAFQSQAPRYENVPHSKNIIFRSIFYILSGGALFPLLVAALFGLLPVVYLARFVDQYCQKRTQTTPTA
jgi:hypothetical protein